MTVADLPLHDFGAFTRNPKVGVPYVKGAQTIPCYLVPVIGYR